MHERWSQGVTHWRWYDDPAFWERVDEQEAISWAKQLRHAHSKNAKRRQAQ